MERKLARGLDALLPKGGAQVAASQAVQAIPVDAIRPNPRQPRREFDPDGLRELQESIAHDGLLQPIVVRRAGEHYELIAGERRWRACQALGHARIPALIRTAEKEEPLVLALVENIQRRNLDAIEEARAFRQLIEDFGLAHEDVAKRVGRERSTVTNTLRLLELPEEVQREVSRGTLTAGHARALLPLVGRSSFQEVLGRIHAGHANVRQTEAWVREAQEKGAAGPGKAHESRPLRRDPALVDLERKLKDAWGTPIALRLNRRGGRITFVCTTRREFESTLQRLATPPRDRSAGGAEG